MKFLVIRFREIGDVVLTSTLCNTLKKSFPDAQVDYLMYETSSPLFEHHPYIDNVITISAEERKSPIQYLKKVWSVTRVNYDVIIDTSSTGKSELFSLFSKQATFRIGRKKRGRGFCYTHKIPTSELQDDKVSQRVAMLKPLVRAGYEVEKSQKMVLHLTNNEKSEYKNIMLNHGIDFNRPIFAFSVSSKESQKKWCVKYMSEVVTHCIEKYQAQIILFAGLPHERIDADLVYRLAGKHKDIFADIPSYGLRNLAALLSHCDIFVGNEGGPRHIAHALGLPSVTVFSPSSTHLVWLPEKGARHQGIQWQDLEHNETDENPELEYGGSKYFRLYNSIKSADFIPLVDRVVRNTLDNVEHATKRFSILSFDATERLPHSYTRTEQARVFMHD